MSVKTKLGEDLKEAMRAKDTVRLDTVRSIRAGILQREVDTQKELDDAGILEIVRSLRKQRIESIDQYKTGGRDDLVAKEMREKELLESYLPSAPDAATIETTVRALITELHASSIKDMGRVMQAARDRLSGADGRALSDVIKRMLSGGS